MKLNSTLVMLFAALLLANIVSGTFVTAETEWVISDHEIPIGLDHGFRDLTPRAPISINGNADFATQAGNEGWPGDGTEGNPYIIEGYNISASASHGIHIQYTTVHFIIRNTRVQDGWSNTNDGIRFNRVHHGMIENCTLYNNNRGVRLDESSKNTIQENTVEQSRLEAMYLHFNSNENTVRNNSLSSSRYSDGWCMVIERSYNNNIFGNHVFNNLVGIIILFSEYNMVSHNTIDLNDYVGIYLYRADHNIFHGNTLSFNMYGFESFQFSRYNIISGNLITYNTYGIRLEDESENNKILDNIIGYNSNTGIYIDRSNTEIVNNTIRENSNTGIYIVGSYTEIVNNTIRDNGNYGLYLEWMYGFKIYHNNFIDNEISLISWEKAECDNGYPDGGNYYSDWSGLDEYCGPEQDMPGSDGITDEPRVLQVSPGGNEARDNYPWLEPNGWLVAAPRVTLLKPTGGEIWEVGTEEEVVWTTTEGYGNINNICIQFSDDAGETWTDIVDGADDTGSYMWTLPADITTDAVIRIIVNDDNNRSGYRYSDTFTIGTMPSAPRDLEAEPGNQQITLSWNPPLNNGGTVITGYNIFRGPEGGDLTLHDTVDGVSNQYMDTNLSNGITYRYMLSASNGVREGEATGEVSAIPGAVPSVPVNVTISQSDGTITLDWDEPEDNGGFHITEYRIYWDTTPQGFGNMITHDASDPTNYVHEWLTNGVTYYYKISSVNQLGEGESSGSVQGTPLSLPSAPRNLAATPGDREVTLVWEPPLSDGGTDILGYRIYRGLHQHELSLHDTVNADTLMYTDEGLTNGVRYHYRLSACVADGEGPPSYTVDVVPMTTPSVTRNPVAVPGTGEITLGWNTPVSDGGSPILHYRIYRGTSSTSLTFHGTVAYGTLTFDDTGLVKGLTYHYRISSVNEAGEGAASDLVNAVPKGVASQPRDLSTTPGDRTITLNWNSPANTAGCEVAHYRIYRGIVSGTGDLIGTVSAGSTVYTDSGLTNGVTYYYRVSVVNEIGEGDMSEEVGASPGSVPGMPRDTIISSTYSQIHLTWSSPAETGGHSISQYRVYRGNTSGALELIGTLDGVITEYTDSGLEKGTTYYYRVSAVNEMGEGELCSVLTSSLRDESDDDPFAFPSLYWLFIGIIVILTALSLALALSLIRGKGKPSEPVERKDETHRPSPTEPPAPQEKSEPKKLEYEGGWLPPKPPDNG